MGTCPSSLAWRFLWTEEPVYQKISCGVVMPLIGTESRDKCAQSLSGMDFAVPRTIAGQAPLSAEFSQ